MLFRNNCNEAADLAAKEATGWREGDGRGPQAGLPEKLYPLKATLKTWSKDTVKRQWQTEWAAEPRGSTTRRHTPIPTKKVLQLHQGRNKQESAMLVQMRTEKIGLRAFLFDRRVAGVSNPRCACGGRRQTVSHVLLSCPKLRDIRRKELGRFPGRDNLRAILNSHKLATKAIRFMEQTQILGHDRIENA